METKAFIEKHAPKKKNVSPSKKHHVISQINTCNISLINTFFWICWTQQKIYIYIIISIYNIKAVYKSVDPNIYKEHLTWTEPALVSSTRGRCGSVVTPRWAWCSASRSPQHKGCFKCPCGTKNLILDVCFFVWWSGDGIFVGWGWEVRCFGWNEILFDFFLNDVGRVTASAFEACQWRNCQLKPHSGVSALSTVRDAGLLANNGYDMAVLPTLTERWSGGFDGLEC